MSLSDTSVTTYSESYPPSLKLTISSVADRNQSLKLFFIGPYSTAGRFRVLSLALRRLLKFCGIDRPVCLYDPEVGDTVYRPLYEVASSKLARKTHVDMLNKVQINYYAAGLHREGSKAVFRYTSLELADRFALLNAAFGEEGYKVEGL